MMNSGREITASEASEMAWSSGRPARAAASAPRRRASGTMTAAVIAARTSEFVTSPRMSGQIGDSTPAA
jgi:hypothetical protein